MTPRSILGLLAVFFLLAAAPCFAQVQEVPLDARIDAAELIVEGELLHRQRQSMS